MNVGTILFLTYVCSFCIGLVHIYLFAKTIYMVYHGLIIVFPNFDFCHEYFTFLFQIPNNLFYYTSRLFRCFDNSSRASCLR